MAATIVVRHRYFTWLQNTYFVTNNCSFIHFSLLNQSNAFIRTPLFNELFDQQRIYRQPKVHFFKNPEHTVDLPLFTKWINQAQYCLLFVSLLKIKITVKSLQHILLDILI